MAVQLPRPEEVGGAVWRHDWHRYEDYKTIHHSYITNLFNEGLIEEDTLTFHEYRTGRTLIDVNVEGRIRCTLGVIIEIDKWLEVDTANDPSVRGYSYRYHAWLAETHQGVLRYDNAHGVGNLHCHLFDLRTGEASIIPCPRDSLPALDGFIRLAIKRVQDVQA